VRADTLSILEAAYAETADADVWIRVALDVLAPHLDEGSGVVAHRFAHEADGFRAWSFMGVNTDVGFLADLEKSARHGWRKRRADPDWRLAYPCSPLATTIRRLVGGDWSDKLARVLEGTSPELIRKLTTHRDAFGVLAADPSCHGCLFFSTRPRPIRTPARRLAHWQRIAAHLATGYRLARRRSSDRDAVLAPAGKLLHREEGVTSEQCEALSEAARAIDRARGKLRRVDPDRALALWKGLVSGRWSLVEHFDNDGKRLVVAKRNTLGLRPWHTLNERELQAVAFVAQGQTLKMIAYQLGVSTATVAFDLARAQSKLELGSRLELAAAYRARYGARGPA
jgi:DNA-binding CsgD family transcriptional regulator